MFFPYLDTYWFIFIVPAMIIAAIAQARVSSAFGKYSKIAGRRGITGLEAAKRVLSQAGVGGVSFGRVRGSMSDYYDPRSNTIFLSDTVYDSTSIAALGVAAHEAGHAVQYALGYFPIKIRSAIIPITKFGSTLSVPLILLGFLFGGSTGEVLLSLGILLYATVFVFQLVTLPVEYNASSRALEALESGGVLGDDEIPKAKVVLSAAAMTYLAALITALAQLLRIIFLTRGRRRRD